MEKTIYVKNRELLEAYNDFVYNNNLGLSKSSIDSFLSQQREETGWVSVKERLPEDESNMAVIIGGSPDNNFHFYSKGLWYCDNPYSYGLPSHGITHWMPLPPSPVGDNK